MSWQALLPPLLPPQSKPCGSFQLAMPTNVCLCQPPAGRTRRGRQFLGSGLHPRVTFLSALPGLGGIFSAMRKMPVLSSTPLAPLPYCGPPSQLSADQLGGCLHNPWGLPTPALQPPPVALWASPLGDQRPCLAFQHKGSRAEVGLGPALGKLLSRLPS